MRLSSKHQAQAVTVLTDFTGGLNTAAAEEFIQDNQLSEVFNMEADMISKKLSTVLGTKDVMNCDQFGHIIYGFWDNINSHMLLFTDEGDILSCDENFDNLENIGKLDNDNYEDIKAVCWEDGVLVANGGKIQYIKPTDATSKRLIQDEDGQWKYEDYFRYSVDTIENSPSSSYGIFIRSGRVVVHDGDDNLLYSGTGDENFWEQDPNDPSAALFAEIGYKAGGKIVGVTPNSTDILILKDNGLCYKLSGEYPDWKISEVSRELYCSNVDSSCSLGDGNAMVLGNGILQNVSTTQDYGDMKPSQMGQQIPLQIASLPENTKLRYLASLNQVWFVTGTQYVLVFDVGTGSFYQRWFNKNVRDVINVKQKAYLLRDDRISVLDFNDGYLQDCGEPLIYQARFKTELNTHDTLVKTEGVSVTPLVKFYDKADVIFSIGKVDLNFPLKRSGDKLVQTIGETQRAIEPSNIPLDERYYPKKTVYLKARKMFRGDRVRLFLSGKGFPFTLNFITYEKVEV